MRRYPHKLEIEVATETRGAQGSAILSWACVETAYARVRPLTANEQLRAQQIQARVTHLIELRYTATLTHKHRLNFCGRIFEVKGMTIVDERNRYIEIMAEELAS